MHNDTHSLDEESFIDPHIPRNSIPLRPEEKLIDARLLDIEEPVRQMSALEALQLLAGVDRPESIGHSGPVVASRALAENRDVKHLRLFEVVFGRDALLVAGFVFDQFPELMRTTIRRLAELQGVRHDDASEEEPGKIVHEARQADDPLAVALAARRGWGWPYYGTVDATPLFMRAIVRYAREKDPRFLAERYQARDGQSRTIFDALRAATDWLKGKMDANAEGLVESLRMNKIGGNVIQSWKDSADSHHHADGRLANSADGISSIEVQALAYDAFLDVAELYQTHPRQREEVAELTRRAEKLRACMLERFWLEDERGGYFALGSDRDTAGRLELLDVRASNMGHLLNSRLLDGSDADMVRRKNALVQTLFAPDMLTVCGIRTLSKQENRFSPFSYHNGSVWPWDNFYISLGLQRQGYAEQARELWRRIKNVVATTRRFPELVSGGDDAVPTISHRVITVLDTRYHLQHKIEQPPQEIQAWTVAAILAIEHLEKQHD